MPPHHTGAGHNAAGRRAEDRDATALNHHEKQSGVSRAHGLRQPTSTCASNSYHRRTANRLAHPDLCLKHTTTPPTITKPQSEPQIITPLLLSHNQATDQTSKPQIESQVITPGHRSNRKS